MSSLYVDKSAITDLGPALPKARKLYQANYVLKKKGSLLLIGRENWEFSISDKFELVEDKMIRKGDSVHKIWLLEKK